MAREQPSVAYLGPKSSYTSQAAFGCFSETEVSLTPKSTIHDVFDAVQSGSVDRGVVPFENSSNGPVIQTLDLLSGANKNYPDIYISGEAYLDVRHCLLGLSSHSDRLTPPLTPESPSSSAIEFESSGLRFYKPETLKQIKRIYSHPQAFGQCDVFLSKHLPHVERHEVSSTALAARMALKDPERTSAAIGSAMTARSIGLDLLAENVQDAKDNTTRFLVLKRFMPTWFYEPCWPEHSRENTEEKKKMLVSFLVEHDSPGALADALAVFKSQELNLTSVSSRPSRKQAWQYRHFVEFEWREPEDGGESPVDIAWRELGGITRDLRCHGAWGTTLEW